MKMAKLNCAGDSISILLLLFLHICSISTFKDTDFYNISPENTSQNKAILLFKGLDSDTVKHVRKRQIPPQSPIETTTSTSIPPKNSTLYLNLPKLNHTSAINSTARIPLFKDVHKHLLGENGTGIRNYNVTLPAETTIKPQLTTLPLNSSVVSTTAVPPSSSLPPLSRTDSYSNSSDSNDSEDDDFSISKFDIDVDNNTFTDHNATAKMDTHVFYNSTFITDPEVFKTYWVEMNDRDDIKVQIHDILSTSHRRAATVNLSFDFPFYGNPIRNVTIATGGFIYTGFHVHSWLAATQYIAPLMANFDTSLSEESFVKYVDNGTAFTVEWSEARLQDNKNLGPFTFQVTLFSNGDIVFAYKNVPEKIELINDVHHPVKVGLSDAYIIDNAYYLIRRKTIFEYHRVNFPREDIDNNTVIYLKALPTCLSLKTCDSCINNTEVPFRCSWCPSENRCSSGLDRFRQNWVVKGCDKLKGLKNICSMKAHELPPIDDDTSEAKYQIESNLNGEVERQIQQHHKGASTGIGVSGIVAVLFLFCILGCIVMWVLYAYRNPHTTSGQILIRYRPSQWRWRRGEARYTAATIHM